MLSMLARTIYSYFLFQISIQNAVEYIFILTRSPFSHLSMVYSSENELGDQHNFCSIPITKAIENAMDNRSIDVAKWFFIYDYQRVPCMVIYGPQFGEGGGNTNRLHSPTWSIYS